MCELVQTIDGPLGKYGRATAGPGQQRIDVLLGVGPLPRFERRSAGRPGKAAIGQASPGIPDDRPRQWSAAFRAKGRSGQDERRAATFAGRPDRRRRTARQSPTVGNGAQSNGSSTIARERGSFAASRPATPIRLPTARAFRSARRPTGSVSPPNSRGGEAAGQTPRALATCRCRSGRLADPAGGAARPGSSAGPAPPRASGSGRRSSDQDIPEMAARLDPNMPGTWLVWPPKDTISRVSILVGRICKRT